MYKKVTKILLFSIFFGYIPLVTHAEIFNRQSPKSEEIYNSPSSAKKESEKKSESHSGNAASGGRNQANEKEKPNDASPHQDIKPAPSTNIYPFYIDAASYCSHEWSSQQCMKTLSGASLVMVSNYAEELHKKGHGQYLEPLKQNCAASTAGTKVDVPAYAQRSAFVECINHIVTINEKTGVKPDPDFYQLIVGSIICFDKNQSCVVIEQSLDSMLAAHKSK